MLFSAQGRAQTDSFRMFNSLGNLQEDYPLLNAQICQEMKAPLLRIRLTISSSCSAYQVVMDNDVIKSTMQYFASNITRLRAHDHRVTQRPPASSGKLSFTRHVCFDVTSLFQRHEVQALVQDVYGMKLDDDQFEPFVASARWAAGIYIICHSGILSENLPQLVPPGRR